MVHIFIHTYTYTYAQFNIFLNLPKKIIVFIKFKKIEYKIKKVYDQGHI